MGVTAGGEELGDSLVRFKCPILESDIGEELTKISARMRGGEAGQRIAAQVLRRLTNHKQPEGSITRKDLALLDSFFGYPKINSIRPHDGYTDLTGLEYATNLTTLLLHENDIADVTPVANLTKLTDLDLSANKVADALPLANSTNLTSLGLGDQVTDLSPLAKLTNLTMLGLEGNRITDLTPLANLTNLVGLELGGNQISDLSPLRNLTKLEDLILRNNPVSGDQQSMLRDKLPNCKIEF
ncbi:MAG: hypothetical protein CMI30_08540 [Opitutae bacterium]|nr:hypothetical protein [Opitutae bacterium]